MKQGCEIKKLGEVIKEYSVRNKNGAEYPVYSVTNSLGFCKDYFSKEVASKEKRTYKIVPKGYFAYNPSRINVGSIDWQRHEDYVIVSPLYVVFETFKIINNDYLLYYLKSATTMLYINNLATGTVRANLKFDILSSFPICIPPLPVQEQIVSELDLLSGIIEKKREQLKELDALAQSIFYDMFGDPITNEKGWEVKKLGEVCESVSYGTSNSSSENGVYKYLRMNNITYSGQIDITDIKYIDISEEEYEKYVVRKGDILFNRTNSKDLVGKTALFDFEEEMIIAGYIIRVRVNQDSIIPTFVVKWLNTPFMKSYFKNICKGAVNQSNINSKELKSISIPIPPLPLQRQFASKIEAIERQKELIKQSISETETLFNERMQHYFS